MKTLVQYKFALKRPVSFEREARSRKIIFFHKTIYVYTYFKVPSVKQSFTVLRIKESGKNKAVDMKIRDNDTGEWKHFETRISDSGQLRKILINLGCHALVTFRKTRKTYRNAFIRMDLDSTKELGTFLEVKFSLARKKKAEEFLTGLGVDISQSDKRSVLEIYLSKKKR